MTEQRELLKVLTARAVLCLVLRLPLQASVQTLGNLRANKYPLSVFMQQSVNQLKGIRVAIKKRVNNIVKHGTQHYGCPADELLDVYEVEIPVDKKIHPITQQRIIESDIRDLLRRYYREGVLPSPCCFSSIEDDIGGRMILDAEVSFVKDRFLIKVYVVKDGTQYLFQLEPIKD